MMTRSAAGLCAGVAVLGALVLAGCGGSSSSGSDVPPNAVAVVGSTRSGYRSRTTLRSSAALDKDVVPCRETDWIAATARVTGTRDAGSAPGRTTSA
jgi:hypothetical protein